MKRLLIVAPHFAPISAPDGQRARMLAPHLPDFGWSPHVLTVDPAAAETPIEPELARTLPPDLAITRVPAWPPAAARRVGLGNIAWRAWFALKRAGDRLLRERRFDLVYFSTTQFACLPLGRYWRHRYGVPFVIDLQDPWRSDYRLPAGVRPPGGWKNRFARAQARRLEPWTLRRAAGVIAVSPVYLDQLAQRYPWWRAATGCALPMGWSERDFDGAAALAAGRPREIDTVRYLGRLGTDLQVALEVFLDGFSRARKTDTSSRLRGDFRGGSYATGANAGPVLAAAKARGVADAVREHAARVPYLESLALLKNAGANLILGSDDDGYAPSKIWLTLAAGRPWLALARDGTVLHRLLAPHAGPGGRLVDLSRGDAAAEVAEFCLAFAGWSGGSADRAGLAETEARQLARRHADFFAKVLSSS